jgi:hypothetical protein
LRTLQIVIHESKKIHEPYITQLVASLKKLLFYSNTSTEGVVQHSANIQEPDAKEKLNSLSVTSSDSEHEATTDLSWKGTLLSVLPLVTSIVLNDMPLK